MSDRGEGGGGGGALKIGAAVLGGLGILLARTADDCGRAGVRVADDVAAVGASGSRSLDELGELGGLGAAGRGFEAAELEAAPLRGLFAEADVGRAAEEAPPLLRQDVLEEADALRAIEEALEEEARDQLLEGALEAALEEDEVAPAPEREDDALRRGAAVAAMQRQGTAPRWIALEGDAPAPEGWAAEAVRGAEALAGALERAVEESANPVVVAGPAEAAGASGLVGVEAPVPVVAIQTRCVRRALNCFVLAGPAPELGPPAGTVAETLGALIAALPEGTALHLVDVDASGRATPRRLVGTAAGARER
ncbi:MAG: hypothetical protein CMN31_13315 [Sandaracinus sp.]|nr:hypothetical protein [Sandaracinus sp.]